MICGHGISNAIWWELAHFGLSAFSGWLVYSLTWITLRFISQKISVQDSYIRRISFLAGLSAAIVSHVLEDYFIGWF